VGTIGKRIRMIVAAAFLGASLVGVGGASPEPAAAATMNPQDSYLVCHVLSNAAALYFPYNATPRYNLYAIRIDNGAWQYSSVMYFSYGREWQLLNGAWVATGSNWAPIWAPDDGRSHRVEVQESRSLDGRTWSAFRQVLSPCNTGTLWAPMF
jgi:hypothetical protein